MAGDAERNSRLQPEGDRAGAGRCPQGRGYGAAEPAVAKGRNLKETMAATREVMDPKFSSFAIYEHCLPFNVSRAFDEASGIDDPVIWTDKRDQEMWAALQGG